MIVRFLRHVCSAYWQARRAFPVSARTAVAAAIERAEEGHAGEICFVVETSLTPMQLLRGMSARERALALFAQLHVWDTAANSGVLVYVLLADHAVEILADRGLHPQGDACWPQASERILQAFRSGEPASGCVGAVTEIGDFLRRAFPVDGANPDELPNAVRLF